MVLTPQQLEAMMPDGNLLLSDEPEMESSLQYMQLLFLVSCLEWVWEHFTNVISRNAQAMARLR